MNIQILQLIDGAKKATGLTVIIDVFRAFSVEAWLFHNGAKEIIPVGKMEEAYALKEKDPNTILLGERKGAIQKGFDYGNSPSQIKDIDFTGKSVVHTTSAGTQGIVHAVHSDEILAGSLLTAKAVARYIREKNPETVSLVCMGLEGKQETEEDTLCARYIKSLLEDAPMEPADEIEDLRHTSGSKFFDSAQQFAFPQADFALCTEVDKFSFVLRYEKEGEFGKMRKIDL